MEQRIPQNRLLRFAYLMMHRYLRHRVGVQSAALAFYLLFMLFPFLIFVSALLGQLQLDVAAILQGLRGFLPREVVAVAEMYLNHVSRYSSTRLLLFGLVFSVYFPMRVTNALLRAVRVAYHLGPPRGTIAHISKSLLYTVVLIASIAVTLLLMTVSDRALGYAVDYFRFPEMAAELWAVLRFPLIGAVGFFALFALYALARDDHPMWRDLWPGTLAALAVWLGVSWIYTWYVESVAHYSLLYGSIGAVIVLLVWLYLTAVILIMGAELNGVLAGLRKEQGGR